MTRVPRDLTADVVRLLESRVPFCQATVLRAPPNRGLRAGDKLLVLDDGSKIGQVGSARLTEAIVRLAAEEIERGEMRTARLTLDGELLPVRRTLRSRQHDEDAVEVAFEPMLPPDQLVIAGAGHIAVPLAKIAAILGFEVTVIDDRAQFANRERFPDAAHIVVDEFERAIASLTITRWTYLVLVTRSHEHDEATLHQVVTTNAPYIGMIGSRRRVLLVFQRLRALGVPERFAERIYAPIGLDIGARTAEEIALAIMAEIVNVKRGGAAPSLASKLRRRAATGADTPARETASVSSSV